MMYFLQKLFGDPAESVMVTTGVILLVLVIVGLLYHLYHRGD